MVIVMQEGATDAQIQHVIDRLIARFGYCRSCAGDAASMMVRKRFHDLVV